MECRLEEGIWFNINRDEVPFWQIFLLVKLGVKLICNYWTIFTEDKARSHLTGGSGELFQSLKIFILCILTVITNTKSISPELQIWKTIRTVHFRTRESLSLSHWNTDHLPNWTYYHVRSWDLSLNFPWNKYFTEGKYYWVILSRYILDKCWYAI